MSDNVQAPNGGPNFTTDQWIADPKGASQVPATKAMFGSRDVTYIFVDDIEGQRFPVKVGSGPRGPITDITGTIGLASTDQVLDPANPIRNALYVLNSDPATVLYANVGAPAGTISGPAPGALPIPPGQGWSPVFGGYLSTDAVHLWSTLTGHAFLAKKG